MRQHDFSSGLTRHSQRRARYFQPPRCLYRFAGFLEAGVRLSFKSLHTLLIDEQAAVGILRHHQG